MMEKAYVRISAKLSGSGLEKRAEKKALEATQNAATVPDQFGKIVHFPAKKC